MSTLETSCASAHHQNDTALKHEAKAIRTGIQAHSTCLNQHGTVLDQHTAKLDEHTAKLDEHTAKLDQVLSSNALITQLLIGLQGTVATSKALDKLRRDTDDNFEHYGCIFSKYAQHDRME